MIYTIGYQNLQTGEQLAKILQKNGITHLLDVRSRPYSRKPAFNKNRLEKVLPANGIEYRWLGDKLGGFSAIEEKHIKVLAHWSRDRTGCLMCMEADPDKCHRKTEIARRLKEYCVIVDHILTK